MVRRIVASDDEDEGGESSPVAVAPPVAGGLTKKKKVSAVEVDEKEEGTPPPKKANVEPSSSSRWAALKRPKRESRAVKLGVVDVAEEEVIGRMGALVKALDEEGGLRSDAALKAWTELAQSVEKSFALCREAVPS